MTKNRKEMGEIAWAEYQRIRKNDKAMKYNLKNVDKVVNCRRNIKQRLIEYKGGRCEVCGFNKECSTCYDFHHKDPKQKLFTLSKSNKSFEQQRLEADKCMLLCKNCHAEIHDKEYTERRIHTAKRLKCTPS
jgi:hypothetical protein